MSWKSFAKIATAIPTGGLSLVGDKLLGSAGGVVGNLLNEVTGANASMDKSLANNMAVLQREFENNVNLWNMENEYNTPSAQMARMKQAGIDINPMTYAVGNGNMSTTAGHISAPSASAGGGSASGNPISMLFSVLSGIKGLESAELDNQIKKKAVANYENEHMPAYLQVANFISTLLGNGTSKNIVELASNIRNKAKAEVIPDLPSFVPSTNDERDKYFRDLNQRNRDWWERIAKYSTKYGDGTWKKHLLD